MKKDLHPTSYTCDIACACGNKFTTSMTKESMKVEICNECHPFFTGSQKIVDTAGRIEKFNKRYNLDK
ncbi:MAG: 50S ribosomal protein L31 [Helicobacteraceae bacterium]|nr:50S ribosomal protein L31 [Helicobacteraceae bacterium]